MTGLHIDLSRYRSEEELLAALRSGQPDACTCLVKRFAELVYRPALRILADADEADEVVQATFITACEKIGSFEARSQLGTWLYRIATNEALMRRRQARPQEPCDPTTGAQPPDNYPGLASPSTDPVHAALGSELRAHLGQAMMALPETLRIAFVLRDLQGFSTEETAAALAVNASTVKVRLHRARRRLRTLLAAYLASEEQG